MTQFSQIKLLYNQFFNLADEIITLVEAEDYSEIIAKLHYKDTLITKFSQIKKHLNLNEEEKQEMKLLEEKLIEKEQNNIDLLKEMQDQIGAKLNKTDKNLKLNSAYTVQNENQGSILDFTE